MTNYKDVARGIADGQDMFSGAKERLAEEIVAALSTAYKEGLLRGAEIAEKNECDELTHCECPSDCCGHECNSEISLAIRQEAEKEMR